MSNITYTKLRLNGNAVVHIDWANVYNWKKALDKPISPVKLIRCLKTHSMIKQINFYFGTDTNTKSKAFLNSIKKLGFKLHTKPVKYVRVNEKPLILKRKCDFDLEICMQTMLNLDRYKSYIFFTGDGDFAPLYEHLTKNHKQVIVVYAKGHIGKEVWEIKKGIFKVQVQHLF